MRRWRLFSVRYARERAWVERWLHMISRSLEKQPGAASAMVRTATMIDGFGARYRHGLADWHAIIDGLAKPTFDGVLPLADLAGAVAEARAAAAPDPRQVALKRAIAEIRARALSAGTHCRGGVILLRVTTPAVKVRPHALCAVLTTTTLSSWPACRFR